MAGFLQYIWVRKYKICLSVSVSSTLKTSDCCSVIFNYSWFCSEIFPTNCVIFMRSMNVTTIEGGKCGQERCLFLELSKSHLRAKVILEKMSGCNNLESTFCKVIKVVAWLTVKMHFEVVPAKSWKVRL